MPESSSSSPLPDPFTAFWTDFLGRASSAGFTPPASDKFDAMRKAFFGALSEHADAFMRSEAFLSMMKQSMEQSLAWQQTMNEYLRRGLTAAQVPTRADADHIVMLIRGMEERVVGKLEQLEQRVGQLEANRGKSTKSA